jgi:hypothetical protein
VSSLLGAPLIPCLFLVLGANLAEGPGAAQVRRQHTQPVAHVACLRTGVGSQLCTSLQAMPWQTWPRGLGQHRWGGNCRLWH